MGVVFERFPASVRGAVVVRGSDPDPHQVSLASADVVELRSPNRPVRPVALDPVTVELAPRGEVLLPFDIPFAGLDPGWYGVVAEVVVDGQRRVRGPAAGEAKRFLVAWPGQMVRKGTMVVQSRIPVPGTPGAMVDRVECKGDRAVIRWHHEPSDDPEFRQFGELRVLADGKPLPFLDSSYQPAAGTRSTVVYPLLRANQALELQIDRLFRPDGQADRGRWSLELPLP
ncbi:MAG TPA: hypothetical protein VFH75_03260 [Actinomycetota bacterium]|nr:hypothetical protein [Actinomycetota bacterium]